MGLKKKPNEWAFNGPSEGLIFSASTGPTTSGYSPAPLVVWDDSLFMSTNLCRLHQLHHCVGPALALSN